jgi:hypothetical protein
MSGTDERAIIRLGNVAAMLTSPNDGERANAALLATRILQELGLDWRELVRRAFRFDPEPHDHRRKPVWDDRACEDDDLLQVYLTLLRWDGLNNWERGFLRNLFERGITNLSEKQSACLAKISRRWKLSRNNC